MDAELDRFNHEWALGDRDVARDFARDYIKANHARLAPHLESRTQDDLVRMVDAYREAGREEDRIIVDMWLLAYYDPKHISGAVHIGGIIDSLERSFRGEVA